MKTTHESAMRRRRINPWQVLPRERKLVKAHVRLTKRGIQFVEPHMREYPTNPFKDMPKPKSQDLKRLKQQETQLNKLLDEKRKFIDAMRCHTA